MLVWRVTNAMSQAANTPTVPRAAAGCVLLTSAPWDREVAAMVPLLPQGHKDLGCSSPTQHRLHTWPRARAEQQVLREAVPRGVQQSRKEEGAAWNKPHTNPHSARRFSENIPRCLFRLAGMS